MVGDPHVASARQDPTRREMRVRSAAAGGGNALDVSAVRYEQPSEACGSLSPTQGLAMIEELTFDDVRGGPP
jgi:hypothetical protein